MACRKRATCIMEYARCSAHGAARTVQHARCSAHGAARSLSVRRGARRTVLRNAVLCCNSDSTGSYDMVVTVFPAVLIVLSLILLFVPVATWQEIVAHRLS